LPAEWPALFTSVRDIYKDLASDQPIPAAETSFWKEILLEMCERGCLSGDKKYLDELLALTKSFFPEEGKKRIARTSKKK
jgi:hypothetical protein